MIVASVCVILLDKFDLYAYCICDVTCVYGAGHGDSSRNDHRSLGHRSLSSTLIKVANHSFHATSSNKSGSSKVNAHVVVVVVVVVVVLRSLSAS